MRPAVYPFAAIVGQEEMKLALLLAAVDWRLGVLLRGDKGSGKTTCARGLAALLPAPAPFVNLPIGTTEDRLLGGLNLERALQGEAVLKRGLLSEAHGGVLYVDEVNLLPGHLGDTLLDTAASGVNVVEREGLSESHAAEFVLLGSMNPEEGSLRPQLLDRFALCSTVTASLDPAERQKVVERRLAFERDPLSFLEDWSSQQSALKDQIAKARIAFKSIAWSSEIIAEISSIVCEMGVRSLRADLAIMRASVACAALAADEAVTSEHVVRVLPLVLAHRVREGGRSSNNHSPQASSVPPGQSEKQEEPSQHKTQSVIERVFPTKQVDTPAVRAVFADAPTRGVSSTAATDRPGPVSGFRLSKTPVELDMRATLAHAVLETGKLQPRVVDLQEKVREPKTGIRFLFVIDSSGSHAVQERMRLVKGATSSLLTQSFKSGDEVAVILFRGTSAQMVQEPTRTLSDALAALEYLPTGGRTPMASALNLAASYITPSTVLVLLTDGRANVPLNGGDPWQETLEIARQIHCLALIVDTENTSQSLGKSRELAGVIGARYLTLQELSEGVPFSISLEHNATVQQ